MMSCHRPSSICRLTGGQQAFASAIVIADALIWEGADERVLSSVSQIGDFGQYLVRALIYRAVTELLTPRDPGPRDLTPWRQAIDLACRARSGRRVALLQVADQVIQHLGGTSLAQFARLRPVDAIEKGTLLGVGEGGALSALRELDGGN